MLPVAPLLIFKLGNKKVHSHHFPTHKTFMFVIIFVCVCVYVDVFSMTISLQEQMYSQSIFCLPFRQSQESAALCCYYCVCSSVHEPTRLIDTALSDILRLTPLITEVYTEIHKQSDVHSRNESARGNKQDFLCGENDKDSQKSALITFLMKNQNVENQGSV